MIKSIECPCCGQSVQIIFSPLGANDVKIVSVFFNTEDDLDIKMEQELCKKHNIEFG